MHAVSMMKTEFSRRLARFLVVGGAATALNYAVYLLLLNAEVNYLVAFSIGFVSGIVVSYALNKAWAFSAARESHRKVLPYVGVYVTTLVTTQLLLYVLVGRLGIPASWANVPALAYSTAANFAGLHWLVFRTTSRGPAVTDDGGEPS